MSSFLKSGSGFQRLPNNLPEISSHDSQIDLEANPFDGKKTWDEFKKEYYSLEKKIKKGLESMHLTLIEFTKHISLAEYNYLRNSSTYMGFSNSRSTNIKNMEKLSQDFVSGSKQTKAELLQVIVFKENYMNCIREIS